jgi:hypothetical protein
MTSTYENVFMLIVAQLHNNEGPTTRLCRIYNNMLIVAQLHNNDGANDAPCRIYHNNKRADFVDVD